MAVEVGAAHDATVTLAAGVNKADLIILATPVCAILAILREVAKHVRDDAFVMDVGSTKKSIMDAAAQDFNMGNSTPG